MQNIVVSVLFSCGTAYFGMKIHKMHFSQLAKAKQNKTKQKTFHDSYQVTSFGGIDLINMKGIEIFDKIMQ